MEWWVHIAPWVIRYVRSRGFSEHSPDEIIEAVGSYLARYADQCADDRWPLCPDDYFLYSHIFLESGRLHTLSFLVSDASAEQGVLKIVWVEHFVGAEFP